MKMLILLAAIAFFITALGNSVYATHQCGCSISELGCADTHPYTCWSNAGDSWCANSGGSSCEELNCGDSHEYTCNYYSGGSACSDSDICSHSPSCAYGGLTYPVDHVRTEACGSGTCTGTASVTCQTDGTWSSQGTCSTSGGDCTYSCPSDSCSGLNNMVYNNYPGSVTGACSASGDCSGTCTPATTNCNDNNACTSDSCSVTSGCSNTNVADNTLCSGTTDCDTLDTTCRNYHDVSNVCTSGSCGAGSCNSYTNADDGTQCTSRDTSGTCRLGICVISTPVPVQPTCWSSTRPSDSFSISNGCIGTITSIAWDESGTGDMTYDSSLQTLDGIFIRTTKSDDPAGTCNNENVVFQTKYIDNTRLSPPPAGQLYTVADLTKKCGTDEHSYGYQVSTSNCKILDMVMTCTGVCPTDPKKTAETVSSTDTSRTLKQRVPDISGILTCNPDSDVNERDFAYTFTIGDCLSNAGCSAPTPFCDTNDKRCKGTAPSPRSPESPADGATTSRTPTLDVNPVTDANSYRFYVRSSGQTPETALYKRCSSIDLDWLGVGDGLQLSTTYYWSARACTDAIANPLTCNSCGSYFTPEWSFMVGACDDNDIDVPPAGVGTEDRSSQCSSPPVGQEGRVGRCDLVVVPYTCQYPTCRVRNQCATDYCCGTELPNAEVDYPNLFGQCASKSIRTPNNKFLCTT